ncbi:MAG: DUF5050 domain-containing protein [Clostridiales bacterium]|nr:DUF5050 domain-containing protein [Clostridiales bacterium]
MKKTLLILGLIVIFVVLIALFTHNSDADGSLGSVLGNTNGNIQNDADIITDGDYTYYSNKNDNDHFYAKNISSGEEELISNYKFAYQLNLTDNSLYYISSSPGKIMRTDTETHKTSEINSDYAQNLVVTDKYIFYISASYDDNWGKLYYTDLQGKHKKLLADGAKAFAADIYENCIYYIDKNSGSVNKYDFASETTETLYGGYSYYIDCDENNIYFTDSSQRLMYMNKETGEIFTLADNRCNAVNVSDGIVYYSNIDEGGALYSVNTDGSDRQKSNSLNTVKIFTDGSDLYYQTIDDLENAKGEYSVLHIEKSRNI